MPSSEPGEATPGTPSPGPRIAATLAASVVAIPLLLVYVFQLAWFSSEITDRRECDPRETLGCGPEHGQLLWFGTLLVFVTGSLCLTLTWARMRRRGRWWPWPAAAVTILAGWVVSQSWLL
jgi:hypothetical protein